MRIKRLSKVIAFCAVLCFSSAAFATQEVNIQPLSDITSGQITVNNSATKIPATALSGRRTITIINRTGANLHIGESGVTTSEAWIEDNESISFDLDDTTDLYGILSAGSGTAVYWEIR